MNIRAQIRVDGAGKIGAGHLIRCLSLADYLREKAVPTTFITRSLGIVEQIHQKGFKVKALREDASITDELDVIEKGLSSHHQKNLIIFDINNYQTFQTEEAYRTYLSGVQKKNVFTVSFEDQNIHPPLSNLVVIPYADVPPIEEVDGICNYLIGPQYFVFPQPFLKSKPRQVSDKVKSILITMGGSDPKKITLKVLGALNRTDADQHLTIVIGPFSNITQQDIRNRLNRYRGPWSVIRDCRDMAQILVQSDMAIISSGLTKYETAYLGIPSMVISYDEFHASIMELFVQHGSVEHLGNIDTLNESDLSKGILALINKPQKRRKMATAGKLLVDGKGIDRIFSKTIEGIEDGNKQA